MSVLRSVLENSLGLSVSASESWRFLKQPLLAISPWLRRALGKKLVSLELVV